jgi:hypothetical protein
VFEVISNTCQFLFNRASVFSGQFYDETQSDNNPNEDLAKIWLYMRYENFQY